MNELSGENQLLKRALNGPAPQYYNPDLDQYQIAEGKDGAAKMRAEEGAIVPLGKTTDPAVTDATLSATEISLLKGLVKLLKGEIAQPLISATLDFKGKTTGQTFDVPHTAHGVTASSDPVPTASGWSEFTNAGYTSISEQGGTTASTSTTSNGNKSYHKLSLDLLTALKLAGRIPQSWTVDDLKAALKQIVITWVGYGVWSNNGVSTNGATVKVWNATVSAYGVISTNSAASPSVISGFVGSPASHVDSNGFLHVLAYATYPSDGTLPSTIYTDYVKVDVHLSSEYLLTDGALTYDPANKASRVVLATMPKVQAVNSAGAAIENTEGVLLASATRTATVSSPIQTNPNARGVLVILKVTAASGTGGLVVRIGGGVSGGVLPYINSPPQAVTAVATYGYLLYPGVATAGMNLAQQFSAALPRTWKVDVVHGDASAYTYEVNYSLIV